MASTDAKLVPIKNSAFRVTFPILDADGDLVTSAAGLDSEVSKDGGTFADCTNEATEIATASGMYYLDLTSTEMNADTVAVIVKTSTSGAKTTTLVFYPEPRGIRDLAYPATSGRSIAIDTSGRVDVGQWVGSNVFAGLPSPESGTDVCIPAIFTIQSQATASATSSTIGLASAFASTINDYYNGMIIVMMTGSGKGQMRRIVSYNGTTKVATIAPSWSTTPSSGDFYMLVPLYGLPTDGTAAVLADVTEWLGASVASADGSGRAPAYVGAMQNDVVTAAALASDAAQEIADALLDRASAIEGYTPRQLLRLVAAALFGKADGLSGTTVHYRDVGDTKNRITATVDSDGNRTAVTLDET
jgi:hypothetical protein